MNKKILIILILAILPFTMAFAENGLTSYTAYESSAQIYFGGKQRDYEAPVVTIDGKTYIPLRETAEKLGKEVVWEENNKIHIVEPDGEKVLILALSPRMGGDTMIMYLYESGKLEYISGLRTTEGFKDRDISSANYMEPEIEEKKTIVLPKETMEEIYNMAEKVPAGGTERMYVCYGDMDWVITLYINGDFYDYYYSFDEEAYENDDVLRLIKYVMDVSPVNFIFN